MSDGLIALPKVLKILGYCLFASTPGMSCIRIGATALFFASKKMNVWWKIGIFALLAQMAE